MNPYYSRDIVTETAQGNARRVSSEIELDRDIIGNSRSRKIKKDKDLGSAIYEKEMRKVSEEKLSRAEDSAVELLLDRDALINTIKFLQGKWAPGKKEEFINDAKKKSDELYKDSLKDQLKVDDAHERVEKNINNKNYKSSKKPRSEYSKRKTNPGYKR